MVSIYSDKMPANQTQKMAERVSLSLAASKENLKKSQSFSRASCEQKPFCVSSPAIKLCASIVDLPVSRGQPLKPFFDFYEYFWQHEKITDEQWATICFIRKTASKALRSLSVKRYLSCPLPHLGMPRSTAQDSFSSLHAEMFWRNFQRLLKIYKNEGEIQTVLSELALCMTPIEELRPILKTLSRHLAHLNDAALEHHIETTLCVLETIITKTLKGLKKI